jgi:hypothetical protein
MDSLPPRSVEALQKQYQNNRKGRTTHSTLREQVVYPPPQQMWPTPTAMTGGQNIAPSHKKNKHGWNTGAAVQDSLSKNPIRMWPTPRASGQENPESLILRKGIRQAMQHNLTAAVQMFPTPTARDHKDSGPNTNYEKAKAKSRLAGHAGGSLNPMWVEWLMGYPAGHTDLEDWEMLSFRKSRKKSEKQS